jgi:CDP-glycerol glycerophosphotransferase (TagB/SpsB family)
MNSLKNFITFARTYAGTSELLKRLLETCIGYLIYPIAYIFPRNKNKWLFGTNVGFTDNAKYLYLYTLEQNEVRAIWITNKPEVLQLMNSLQLEVYSKWSIKGLWHCFTAGTYIFTSHSNDINFFTVGRAKKVNLWHGVGIKGSTSGSEGKKRDDAIQSLFYRIVAPHNYEKFDLFLSTGPLMNKHFTKMFNLTGNVLFEGAYPRCNFIQQSTTHIEEHISKYENKEIQNLICKIKKYKQVFLYMPTWRSDLKDNFLKEAGFNFARLNEKMKATESLFLLKLHPAVRHHETYNDYDSLLFLNPNIDVYSLLPYTSTLITDYSSIYYDYLLIPGKTVLLFPFDYNEYIKTSKSLAFDFETYTPGVCVYTFEELLSTITSQQDLSITQQENILKLFWGNDYLENSNNQALYKKIQQL